MVLSLGTGTLESQAQSPQAPHFRDLINDGFVSRLVRSFVSSLDGESVWRELVNRLDESSKQDYFRFNIELTQALDIDDITKMDDLRKSVHIQHEGPSQRRQVISALLATSFFFELDYPPQLESGFYRCEGSIRCRNQGEAVINALSQLHSSQMEFVTDTGLVASFGGRQDICSWCHRYCKHITFYIRHPTETVTLYLKVDAQHRRRISGFPQTMEWFSRQQSLDAVLGTPDHGTPGAFLCHKCKPSGLRRRNKRKFEGSYRSLEKKARQAQCLKEGFF